MIRETLNKPNNLCGKLSRRTILTAMAYASLMRPALSQFLVTIPKQYLSWAPPNLEGIKYFQLSTGSQDQPDNVDYDTNVGLVASTQTTSYDTVVRRARALIYFGGKKEWKKGNASAGERFFGIRECIFREGGHIIARMNGDGFVGGGSKTGTSGPNIYFQNMLVQGINGSFDSVHADGYQHQFAATDLCFDKVTIHTAYQGLFLPPQYPIFGKIYLKRVNIVMLPNPKAETSVPIWLFDTEAQYNNNKYSIFVEDVWITPRQNQNKEKLVFAAGYGELGQDSTSEYIWFPERSRIRDFSGRPAKFRISGSDFSDFVRSENVGINYETKRKNIVYTETASLAQ